MVEAEFVIGNLRAQVRNLQSMLHYLESRDSVGHEEYAYLGTRLREIVTRLKDMQRFSSDRGEKHRLLAQWLN